MLRRILIGGVIATLAGCATPIAMESTGGSRADGSITMSYEYGMFQRPEVDHEAAARTAGARCQAWGYDRAEPFGAGEQTCLARNEYGCLRWRVDTKFQCLGAPSAGK